MISAFCPGHITCFFRPVYNEDILKRGSKGAGIRTSAGTIVGMEEISGRTRIYLNSKESDAKITRRVLEKIAPGRNFEISAECQLPMGQGFGMSASGAIAAGLCAAAIADRDRQDAFTAAHIAEIECGGGLGDVAALMHGGDVPIRLKEGIPPYGSVTDPGIVFDELTIVVLGPKLSTADVLSDKIRTQRICEAGDQAVSAFQKDASKDGLFSISDIFSKGSGVMGDQVQNVIAKLWDNGIRASMCMLGNSIFTDSPKKDVVDVLGDVDVIETSSTNRLPDIIRKV